MRRLLLAKVAPAVAQARTWVSGNKSDVMGIDLGTLYSSVAVMDGGMPRVLEDAEGLRRTPSYVASPGDENIIIGLAAKRQAATNPSSTFFAIKRVIGRQFDDPVTQQCVKTMPYKLIRRIGSGDALVEDASGTQFSPSAISALVLQKMQKTAEKCLNQPKDAVITVPVHFGDAQRQAVREAGQIAGLNILRVVNEPTAAALAYGLHKTQGLIAVYNLGGTFDISILEADGHGIFEVRVTNWDAQLGGEHFDEALAGHIEEQLKKTAGIDLTHDRVARLRVREVAEKAKCDLSSMMQAEITLPFIGTSPMQHFKMVLTRSQLEGLCDDLIQRSMALCKQCLKDAGVEAKDLQAVVMVGGMTRMPKVMEAVKQLFGREPARGVNPDEAVALGAAIQGNVRCG